MFTRAMFQKKLLAFSCFTLLSYAAFISPLYANPQNGVVVAGQATINHSPGVTQINQSSDKAIINWQGFSINADEHTNFQQPNSNSITLNRVTGNQASRIMGKLSANGKIMLLNPAGIIFGPNSRIDVAGLIATTANIDDNDFLAGKFNFVQNPAHNVGIVNEGTITVADRGLVALVAPSVQNNGKIVANVGKVTLAAGTAFTVDLQGDETIQFATGSKVTQQAVTPDGQLMKNAISNSGQIYANGGQVVLTAQVAENIVNNAINMDGVIEAKSLAANKGKIILAGGSDNTTMVSGTLDASGLNDNETGGTIKVLGKNVAILDGANIKASGKKGGGTILIGGDYLGSGDTPRAKATYVAKNAHINADAIETGNGGKVIVWSDDSTWFHGNISANGGANGGDGGFIETSGKNWLTTLSGKVYANAPHGKNGTWLLDPADVYISYNVNTFGGSPVLDFGDGSYLFFPEAGAWQTSSGLAVSGIYAQDVIDALNRNLNVVITTKGGSSGSGNITLDADIIKSSIGTASLTLEAANNIFINANIVSFTDNLNINFTSNQAQAGRTVAGGSIKLNGGAIFTYGGSVSFNGDTVLMRSVTIDTTVAGSNGGNINFGGTVNGNTNLGQDLYASAGFTGNINFAGNVGDINKVLRKVSLQGNNIFLGSNFHSNDFSADVQAIYSIAGTLTAESKIKITAPQISFGNLVSANGDTIDLSGNGTSTITFNNGADADVLYINGFTEARIKGTFTSNNEELRFAEDMPIVLIGDTTINAAGIRIDGNVSGAFALALTDTQGDGIYFKDDKTINGLTSLTATSIKEIVLPTIGNTTAIGSLTTGGTNGVVTLSGSITAQGGAITFNNAVVLANEITIGAANGQQIDLFFNSTLNSSGSTARNLMTNNTGTVKFSTTGNKSALATLTIDNVHTITLNGAITSNTAPITTGASIINVTNTAASINLANNLAAANATINLIAGNFAEDVSLTKALTLVGPSVSGSGSPTTMTSFTTTQPLTLRGNFATSTGNIILPANSSTTLIGDTKLATGSGGSITIGANNAFSGNFNLTFATPTLIINSSLNNASNRLASFTYTSSSAADPGLMLGGDIFTNGNITLNRMVTLTTDVTLDSSTGIIGLINSMDGNGNNLVTAATGTTQLWNTLLTDMGTVNFQNNVDLLGNATVSGTGPITFNSITGKNTSALTVSSPDIITFNSAVGSSSNPIGNLTLNGGGNTVLNGNINSSGTISIANPLSLTTDIQLTAPTISINGGGSITGAGLALILSATNVYIDADIGSSDARLASFTHLTAVPAGMNYGGNIYTTGDIYFGNGSFIHRDTILDSSTGNINLISALDSASGNHALTLNVGSAGIIRIGSDTGSDTPFSSLTTSTTGTTQIWRSIHTTGDMNFQNAVDVSAFAASLISNTGNLTFNSTLDGSQALSITSPNVITFNGAVGSTTPLGGLTIIDSGSSSQVTQITNNITTQGALAINGAILLIGDANTYTLASLNGSNITLGSVNDNAIGSHDLIVNTSGTTKINGAIGNLVALKSLTTDLGGVTEISANVTTQNNMVFNDAVTLKTNNLVFTSSNTGNISFLNTLNGPGLSVTMNTPNTLTLAGAIGSTGSSNALGTFNAGAPSVINLGNNINANTITGNADTVNLTSTSAKISQGALLAKAGGTVNIPGGTYNESVSIAKNVKLIAPTPSLNTPVNILSFTNNSPFSVQGYWHTNSNGSINYNNSHLVTLIGDTKLATDSKDINLGGPITGNYILTLHSSGNTNLTNLITTNTALGGLVTDSGGTTYLTGAIGSLGGGMQFNDNVEILNHTTLTALNNGDITFAGTINGHGKNLTLSGDTITFNGVIGGTNKLNLLNIASANVVNLNNAIDTLSPLTGNATTVNVNNTFASINDGERIVANGGYVNVASGIYNEDILLNKSFNLANNGTVIVNSFTNNSMLGIKGTWVTGSSDFQINGGLNLNGNTNLKSISGNINLVSAINGNHILTTSTNGITTITGNIGGSTPVNSFTANSRLVKLGASIKAQGNTVTFNAPVELIGNSSVSDTGTTGINFNGTVDGTYQLALNATQGNINFADIVGGNAVLSDLLIYNARNVNPQKAVNVINFEQQNGQGLTDFTNNLIAQNNVNINTSQIIGNFIANDVKLIANNKLLATVDVSSLTVGGQNGGKINGKVGGIDGEFASLLVRLASDAVGSFVFNGCLLPGGCVAPIVTNSVISSTVSEFVTPGAEPVSCTVASMSSGDQNGSECSGSIEIREELASADEADINIEA